MRRPPSPLQLAIGHEVHHAYEDALNHLTPRQREALVMRIEFGLSHEKIAEWLGAPSANAARMIVSRAKARLMRPMESHAGRPMPRDPTTTSFK
jgi:DNA-directed RNA polymerase specialized sigma24 family protein